ncbi:MAG: sigma-70 family RNA polymerase sigma factor [bacterium]|nr:sigma-70 family RNA polymerase sigma factor [bacterium]
MQDVNLIAARKPDSFEARSPSSILNGLAQIALNQIRSQNDYFSADKRDKELEVPLSAKHDGSDSNVGAECGIDPTARPDEHAASAELRDVLDGCMAELPESYRDVILWRDYCGMSWQEIVRESGHPSVGAAQQQHRRAWIRLRRCVRPRLGGFE